ncbi:MAG: hypothetical protein E7095_04985 [Bacteroides sp.]|nr:hypothetical protein [Bacteroides sp.]
MKQYYNIAGHKLSISSPICEALKRLPGFQPFRIEKTDIDFNFSEGKEMDIPLFAKELYTLEFEDVKGAFGTTTGGYLMCLTPEGKDCLYLWTNITNRTVYLYGNYEPYLLRYAIWVGYGIMTVHHHTLAIHTSCIVYHDKAVLFLGESGTGKSTHTRLWQEHISGAVLLNDDSPIIRIENEKIWAYGSPWSGKTPCYKNERYELQGCVRLSQAPYNQIQKLTILQSIGALHPSCAPQFAYDENLYNGVSHTLDGILSAIPCYHLACLPNKEAALLSCKTLFV